MATISRFKAIATIGPVRASGFPAWLLWLAVHLFAITGFKNRMAVLSNWAIAFLGRGRPQRAITTQQVFARQALQSQAAVIGTVVSSQPGAGASLTREWPPDDWSGRGAPGLPGHPVGHCAVRKRTGMEPGYAVAAAD